MEVPKITDTKLGICYFFALLGEKRTPLALANGVRKLR